MTERDDTSMQTLLKTAITAARETGVVALDIYRRAEVRNWEKGEDNPLPGGAVAAEAGEGGHA